MALQRPRRVLPVISEGVQVKLDLDTGVLAAAVGPLVTSVKAGDHEKNKSKKRKKEGSEPEKSEEMGKRKRDLLVLLGLRCPEDEVVMQKPVRATRDLFGELTDQERADAVHQARGQSHRLQSPLLPGMKSASFSGQWTVDGQTWTKLVQDGVKLKVPLVSAPVWCDNIANMSELLRNDAAIEEALKVTAVGMIADAQKVVIHMSSLVPHATSLRATALLRQQYSAISMPTPSLQGTADGVGWGCFPEM